MEKDTRRVNDDEKGPDWIEYVIFAVTLALGVTALVLLIKTSFENPAERVPTTLTEPAR